MLPLRLSQAGLPTLLLAVAVTVGCASAPFSQPTPGIATLEEEVPYFHAEPDAAASALGDTETPQLAARVENLFDTYEQELRQAEAASGGFGNTLLGVTTLLVPLSGTVSTLAISDEDTQKSVGAITAGLTTALVAVNLIFKPGKKAAKASSCADFLRAAIDDLSRRWNRDELGSIQGTTEEWREYMTVRSSLEVGQRAACK